MATSSSTSTPLLDPSILPQPHQQQQSSYRPSHPGHGSVGPIIVVLMVIALLGVIAVFVGRICSGRGVRSHLKYDFEGWAETKCASCIDGRVEPPPPRAGVEVPTKAAEEEECGGGGGCSHQHERRS